MKIDDGGRLWFNQTPLTVTADIVSWMGQPPTTYPKDLFTGLAANTRYPITFEWFEGAVHAVLPASTGLRLEARSARSLLANLTPPDGPAAPTLNVSSPRRARRLLLKSA